MTRETRAKLNEAFDYCIKERKSLAFALQYMKDMAHVTHDELMQFLKVKKMLQGSKL